MTDARTALAQAAERFIFSPTARLDAELLLAHALGIERNALLLDLTRLVPDRFWPLVERRARQEPVAYITGTRGFWTLDLMVGPGALVPRVDSETLIDAALRHFKGRRPTTLLDLGTGPGTLLLALLDEWRDARGLGVDRSPQALDYAVANAKACGMADRARFVCGDWATALTGPFDCIVTNPPYIGTGETLSHEVRGYEPASALFAGADGLDDYRALAPELRRLLAPGGAAVVEIGHEQAPAVTSLLEEQGFRVALHRDLGGRPRALLAH
ncbi:peptide chain release factor N(5)-glutamine methyltransferase [Sphingomonas pseudosanguinis]|uniref:Release factor glutamine methyltransferase n=1 Tax=Sphingomonas pseudosanguinis TaxID=413712 RepID=A0A7W6AC79_9SPHN|nr:release factor glutamine methyltransferase [Sphingomonas pseudosanguinis]MBN3536968.1 peptide chain release factor N(5)-glutamine methyltransferase [Sphingomonas pseudosanguinis]